MLPFCSLLAQKHVLEMLHPDELTILRAEDYPWQAGDTLCIPAGRYGGIRFYDLKGTAERPIVIKNCGGQVQIVEHQHSAIEFQRCEYIRFTGSGDENYLFGIEIRSTREGAQGVNITNLSSDIELDHLEVAEAGFAGIMAKTDPVCTLPEGWRRAGYEMKNIVVHDNKIQRTRGEGIYIGYTGSTTWNTNRACEGQPIYGHWLSGVEVYNNLISYTGLDAIQVNLVREQGRIYNNRIQLYGLNESIFQDYAMSLGAGQYEVFNNEIINDQLDRGKGIQVISGHSGLAIYNNLIVRPQSHALFLHMRSPFEGDEGYFIAQNTLVEPRESGIHYNSTITEGPNELIGEQQDHIPVRILNNLILSPGNRFELSNTWKGAQENFVDYNNRSTRDAQRVYQHTNVLSRRADTLYLGDPSRDDFRLMDGRSPLLNRGTDLSAWGIVHDLEDQARPFGNGFDIGAYEGQVIAVEEDPVVTAEPPVSKGTFRFWPNPAKERIYLSEDTFSLSRLRLIQPDGKIVLVEQNPLPGQGIELPSLPHGLYFLEMHWPDGKKQVARLLLED